MNESVKIEKIEDIKEENIMEGKRTKKKVKEEKDIEEK